MSDNSMIDEKLASSLKKTISSSNNQEEPVVDQENPNVDSVATDPINQNPPPPVREVKIDSLGRAYATGKRKTAVARVWIKKGSGVIVINRKTIDPSTLSIVALSLLNEAFTVTGSLGEFDLFCTVKGGGTSAQLQAIRHGIARALLYFNPVAYYADLKKSKLLTRDSRKVERKKFGLKKARKKPQFSKR